MKHHQGTLSEDSNHKQAFVTLLILTSHPEKIIMNALAGTASMVSSPSTTEINKFTPHFTLLLMPCRRRAFHLTRVAFRVSQAWKTGTGIAIVLLSQTYCKLV